MIKKILGFFILLLTIGSLSAQTPFITNYTPADYNAYIQNWSIVQNQHGLMYFGNGIGVLEYDGVNWRTIETQSNVFSLGIDSKDCIYVGLAGDFGYLQADSLGKLQYVSLKNNIPKEHREVKDVKAIVSIGDKVVFKTKNKLFVLRDNHFSVIQIDNDFSYPFIVHNRLYISEKGDGLFYLENDSLVSASGTNEVCDENVISMLPLGKEDILIITRTKGVFIYSPKKSPSIRKPEEFEAVDRLLIKNAANCGTLLPDGNFAIATWADGIFIFDEKGRIKNHYHKQNGLQENYVQAVFTDLNGQLWVALDNGISLIMRNLPFVNYADENGLVGSVYSLQKFKDKLYVGTNNSLYVKNTDNNFDCIEGTLGQNYFLQQANSTLLLGNHPNGVFDINGNHAFQSQSLKGLGTVAGVGLRKHPNFFIAHVWNKGLALIEYKNEHWRLKHFIQGFDKNAMFIVEDITGDLWVYTGLQLCKIRLNETLDRVIFTEDYKAKLSHSLANSAVPFKLNNGEIIFSANEGIYQYHADENIFEPHPKFLAFSQAIEYLKQDTHDNIYFAGINKDQTNEKGVFRFKNGEYEMVKTPFLKFLDRVTISLCPYSDSLVYFGTNEGLLEYHPKQKVNYDIPFNTLIRKVFVNDNLLYGGAEKTASSISDDLLVLEYKKNNLFFHYAATFYEDSEKNLFSYRLMGSSDTTWSAWTNDHKKEYTNLYEGKYIFEVKSQNIYRKFGDKASFTFKILPPWYRTLWAYALYVILLSIFVWILIRLNSVRLKYQNELLKQTVKDRTADILDQKNELQNKTEELLVQSEELQAQSEELQITNEKLVEINASKDKFFSIISHDLKSPFNSILGFADLLNSEYDSIGDAEKREMINELNKSSQHAYDMLANLLSWARTQRGQIKISKEQVDLRELVEKSVAPYVLNASGKGIKIVNNVPLEINFSIDKNTFLTFVGNLVNNAIKFTPEGGTIEIKYHENSDNIVLQIIDTGVGIPPESIQKLFRIDENVSTDGTSGEKGTGLGLILCKEFIEKNGGDISVKSELGKGSEFTITLPK